MEILFLFHCLVALGLFVFLLKLFFVHHRDDHLKTVFTYLFFIGTLYLLLAVFSFLWAFHFFTYVESDFSFILILLILLQTLFFVVIFYRLTLNKHLIGLFLFYLLMFFFVLILGSSFFVIFLFVSFLFLFILFFGFFMNDLHYRSFALWGLVYSGISFLLYVFLFFGVGSFFISSFVASLFFIPLLWFLTKSLEQYPPRFVASAPPSAPHNYLVVFLGHFLFLLVLINFVFVGTVVLHEVGHLGMSHFYDCAPGKIVYDGTFPRTEVLCVNLSDTRLVLLGGMILPFFLSFLLFLVRGRFLREIGLLIIGGNLLISSKDFADLGLSETVSLFLLLVGVLLAIWGILALARSRTEEYLYSSHAL